jgi:hypothetical protein
MARWQCGRCHRYHLASKGDLVLFVKGSKERHPGVVLDQTHNDVGDMCYKLMSPAHGTIWSFEEAIMEAMEVKDG